MYIQIIKFDSWVLYMTGVLNRWVANRQMQLNQATHYINITSVATKIYQFVYNNSTQK